MLSFHPLDPLDASQYDIIGLLRDYRQSSDDALEMRYLFEGRDTTVVASHNDIAVHRSSARVLQNRAVIVLFIERDINSVGELSILLYYITGRK